ncbi:uncharacterized protein LOC112544235 isoform X2 [Pelodiscus sinensis]|uniref:uncharacterized protein LOC112544235 isoform X2 n=1 Tax=Pelodiscus sinensis TaxID=13735 RepID=UPI003F6CDAF3
MVLASRQLAEGVSLLQASPETVSLIELHSPMHAMMLPREEHGRSPFPPEWVEAVVRLGLVRETLSAHSPEPPAQRLEEVSFLHQKRKGKPSPLHLGTTQPVENETYLESSTKRVLGIGALEGQTEQGTTETSLLKALVSSPLAERPSLRAGEATGAVNNVPSKSTETQTMLPRETRAASAGPKAPGQSYSTTWGIRMKTAEALSSPSERGRTVTSSYRKKSGQAHTQPPIGSIFSVGSDTTYVHPALWPPSYQKVLAATETQMESGIQSIVEGIPSQYVGSSLESQTTSPSAGSNGGKHKLSAPVHSWGLENETHATKWHSNLAEQQAIATKLTSGELSTPQPQMHKARTATNSATPGSEESHQIKMTQLQWAFQKLPSSRSTVDSELLHLVGKRSLPEMEERPAPPHGCNPDHTVSTLSHGHIGPLIPNTLEKLQAKVLEALQRQHFLSPEFQRFPATGLHPPARGIKHIPWLEAGTSSHEQNEKCRELCLLASPLVGLFLPKNCCCLNCFGRSPHAAMDKLSGPGKHVQHILPAQRAVVLPGLPNWQVCDFKRDLCGWQQSNTDDFDWILAGERPAGPVTGNTSETQCSPSWGSYISLKSPFSRQTPEQKAALISPILQKLGCIHFWYSPLGSVMGTISIYLKVAGAPEWHRIWSAKGQQGTDWHEVMVEGVIGLEAGSDAAIDDLAFCMAECQEGCEELAALYRK